MELEPTRMFMLATIVGAVALACGSAGREQTPGEKGSASRVAAGRDLSSLDVCALVPGEEVAALFGGTLGRESRSKIYPGASTECSYAIEAGGPTKFVLVFLYPPSHFELFASEEEERQEISGLGDRAYAAPIGGNHQVTVLLEGDVTVDARAATVDEAQQLAELVLTKL
jgi:hypothetical protein